MNVSNTTFSVYVGETHPECLDVVFSSLAKYVGPNINLFAVDNASGHSSYFSQRNIPVHSFSEAKPMLEIMNWIFKNCQTKYLVLLQSDTALFSRFLESFTPTHAIHADTISGSEISTGLAGDSFLDTISGGVVVLDVELLRSKGIFVFDDVGDRVPYTIYHFGSWILKKASEAGVPAQDFEPLSQDFMCYGFISSFDKIKTEMTEADRSRLSEVLSMDVSFSSWGEGLFNQVPVTVQYE